MKLNTEHHLPCTPRAPRGACRDSPISHCKLARRARIYRFNRLYLPLRLVAQRRISVSRTPETGGSKCPLCFVRKPAPRAGNHVALAMRDGRCRTNGAEYASPGQHPISATTRNITGKTMYSCRVFVCCVSAYLLLKCCKSPFTKQAFFRGKCELAVATSVMDPARAWPEGEVGRSGPDRRCCLRARAGATWRSDDRGGQGPDCPTCLRALCRRLLWQDRRKGLRLPFL